MAARKQETLQEMNRRHKEEWKRFREEVMSVAIASDDPEQIKAARAKADILKLYQEGERRTCAGEAGLETELQITWQD